MGGLVSAVTKPFTSVVNTVLDVAKPVVGALGGAAGVGSLIGGATQAAGSYLSADAAKAAADASAAGQIRAAQIAADAARFRPVGVSTRFGSSQFGFSPEGYLTSAGYSVSPELQAIQNRLMASTGGLLSQAEGLNLGPLRQAAQAQFGLGSQLMPSSVSRQASPEALAYANQLRTLSQQALPTSYDTQAAAQQLLAQQQGLLQPGRERQLGQLREQLQRTGRSGFAVAQGGNLAATNPEMAAYYNALAQQDAALTAQAQQQARQNLVQDIGIGTGLGAGALQTQQQAEELARSRFAQDIGLGQGLFGSGAQFLGQVPALQTQYLAPLQSQLGIVSNLEQLGQSPLDIGAQLGGRSAQAGGAQAQALLAGGLGAARTQQAANQYSPAGALLSGLGSNQQVMSGLGNWFSGILNPTPSWQQTSTGLYSLD